MPLAFHDTSSGRKHIVARVGWTESGPYLRTRGQLLDDDVALEFARWILDTFGESAP